MSFRLMYVNAMTCLGPAEIARKGVLEAAKKHIPDLEFINFDCFQGPKLYPAYQMGEFARQHQVDAIILSGSEKNTTDREDPWVQEYFEGLKDLLGIKYNPNLNDWVGPSAPILGICFGHQALACVLGGNTSRFKSKVAVAPTLALYQAENHPVLNQCLKTLDRNFLNIPVFHADQVIELPKGFHILMTSEYCENQAMAHDTFPILSFQGHPEFLSDMLDDAEDGSYWSHVSREEYEKHDGPQILKYFYKWAQK